MQPETALIRAMVGKHTAAEIAFAVGVSKFALKSWAKRNQLPLARPRSASSVAIYNRLRQAAFRAGLRLSMQHGRVSLWRSIAQRLTVAEAEQFLKRPSRPSREANAALFERLAEVHRDRRPNGGAVNATA
jgi:hypothetical protein